MDETTVSDVDLQDVNLVDTPIAPQASPQPSEAANDSQNDDAAAVTDDTSKPATDDANNTEAKDQATSNEAKTSEDAATTTDQSTQEQQQEQKTPEELRQEQTNRARQEYVARQRARNEVAQQLDQTYGPKSAEQLVNEGLNEQAAQIEALRQDMEYREQRAQISELNAGMQAEAINAMNDFPMFNDKSPEYDPEFAREVEESYKIASRLQVDENGIVLNAEVPLYDYYKRMANIYSRGNQRGTQQGRQEQAQMLSRTEDVGGSSSTSGNSSNDLADLEERLGDMVIT